MSEATIRKRVPVRSMSAWTQIERMFGVGNGMKQSCVGPRHLSVLVRTNRDEQGRIKWDHVLKLALLSCTACLLARRLQLVVYKQILFFLRDVYKQILLVLLSRSQFTGLAHSFTLLI